MHLHFLLLPFLAFAQPASSPLDRLDPAAIPATLRLAAQPPEVVAIACRHTRALASLAFSPDGKTLVSAGWDNKLRWWHVQGRELQETKFADGSPSGAAFSPDGKMLVTGGVNADLHLWEPDKKAKSLPGHKNRPFAVAFSPNGKLLASGCGEPILRVWKMEEDEPEAWAILANEINPAVGVSALAFSHDGKYLAMGHHAGKSTLRIWDVGGKIMEEVDFPDALARLVAFSPAEPLLAFSGDDAIRLWDIKDGKTKPRLKLTGHPHKGQQGGVRAITFASDGKTLASCGPDRRVILWDIAHGKNRKEWAFPEPVRTLTFAPDGRHLAVGSEDGSIYILRVAAVRIKD